MTVPRPPGRAAAINPAGRFERLRFEADPEATHSPEDDSDEPSAPPTDYFVDDSQSIVTENDSPDVGFRFSINPYRGCQHGCAYCYARPYHEYLGLSAGLDFETKIFVKPDAPKLFRQFLERPKWQVEPIALSGITDCYQPIERQLELTRGCLAVAAEFRQPVMVITKNRLVTRDIDLLRQLAADELIRVFVSLTTLDADLARRMEPRTSTPTARLEAIRQLREAGVPVGALLAPLIPGLTDEELPSLLKAAADAGAHRAGYVLLRLPGSVRDVFIDWLQRHYPERADRVVQRIRDLRGGKLNDTQFGRRMRGEGPWSDLLQQTFRVFAARWQLDQDLPPLRTDRFRRPVQNVRQTTLFDKSL